MEGLKRVRRIVGVDIPFYQVDVRDKVGLTKVFEVHNFDGVIHFAGAQSGGRVGGDAD